ncbi:MAG: coenzyme F420-0:L-glutamate ligase [Candidatus Thorarchaeota archaeon]|nr:MAG: coenzyme F420-0:L-glutamate ligase [Candidatus Thorarchaeota archaeon]
MSHQGVHAIGIPNIPSIRSGDSISRRILEALGELEIRLEDGDIIVVASKIVSKAEGRVIIGESVEISARAREIANDNNFDPVQVELALRESNEVIRSKGVLITETRSGIVCNFSGVDRSNAPKGTYILLPADPDASARKLLGNMERESGKRLAVIISDTQGRPWRRGSVNIAVGCAGIAPFKYNKGRSDLYGRILQRSTVCQVDEIASLAEPLMGQAGQGIPAVIIRGYAFLKDDDSAKDIVRPKNEDMFR